MARVTVEDCLSNVKNRFELVLLASARARQIAKGDDSPLPIENDKPTVLALREIAEGLVDPSLLEGNNPVLATEAPTAAEMAEIEDIADATVVAETTGTSVSEEDVGDTDQ